MWDCDKLIIVMLFDDEKMDNVIRKDWVTL
jgi:hypothetical protein